MTVYPIGVDDSGVVQRVPGGGGTGTVTSVAVSSPDGSLGVSGSPITSSGTIDLTVNASNIATGVLGVSHGGAGSVSGLLKANGSGTVSAAVSGTDYAPATLGSSILYGNGAGGTSNVTIGTGLAFSGGTLSSTTSGTVTSVGLVLPGTFTISGSPVTGSGNLVATYTNQNANTVFAGPTSGTATTPTFRALVSADLPVGSSSQFGAVKVDGTTITASGGVISAVGGGGSLTVTDGTHSVAGVTNLTVSGGTVSGTSPSATVTVTGGGGGGMTLLDTVAISGSSTSQINFSSISSSYKNLRVIVVGRTLDTASGVGNVGIIFNADTTAAHYPSSIYWFSGGAGNISSSSAFGGFAGGAFPTSNTSNTTNGMATFEIPNYSTSSATFPWQATNTGITTGRTISFTNSSYVPAVATTITGITITAVNGSLISTNFASGTIAYLYGY